jgi:cytoskeleton protein RodZ
MTETDAAAAWNGVGEELARARAALGLSVKDCAQQLKFATRQLEALEQGRFEALPTGTFARGMVRAYAPLVERIADRVAVPDNAAAVATVHRTIPMPRINSAQRSNLIYAALSVAILLVVAGVVYEWQRERAGAARMRFVAPAQAPAEAVAAQPAETREVVLLPVAPAEPAPRPDVVPATQATQATQAAPVAPIAPAPRAATQAGTHRIILRFERESWVEIRGHDGRTLLSQLNPGGSERVVEGRPPFALIIGNAPHVRLSYDERPVDLAPHVKVEVARLTLE